MVILFPLGLLFLFVKDTATVVVTLEPTEDGRTLVRIRGEAPREVQTAFEGREI